jgi:DNA-binding NarL/FixJ family response regulator
VELVKGRLASRTGMGTTELDTTSVDRVISLNDHTDQARSRLDVLSPYQLRVLELMSMGMSNVAIAGHLGVSRRAVENQASRLMQALGLAREDDTVAARVCAVLIYLSDTQPERDSATA